MEGTLVTADYLNNQQGATRDLQQELLNVLGDAHIQPDPKKTDQLLTALRALLLSRKNPFADIKSDGTVKTALENLGLGEGAPAIGVPFFWPSAAMPNTVIDSWSSMVFLKFNGAKFSATDYPVLAKVFPSLVLPEARGDFIRIWDDGRGVDSGRGLLSTQSDLMKQFTLQYYGPSAGTGTRTVFALQSNANGIYTSGISQNDGSGTAAAFNVPGGTETRPRNIAFNFLVRAK
ncbi:integrase [Escherichia coli]|nr:integrase [Escherichia coli]